MIYWFDALSSGLGGVLLSEPQKPERPNIIYLLVFWMIINLLLFLTMIPGNPQDLNNYIEVILWIPSIIGLLMMTKWGAALTVSVLGITLGTSMGNVLLAYYTSMLHEAFAPINALRIAINAAAIVYLLKNIFSGKFR